MYEEIIRIVRGWIEGRDNVTSVWRLKDTGFITPAKTQRGISEFASVMDFRTKELMALLARERGEAFPRAINRFIMAHDPEWYAFRDQCASATPEWNAFDSEALYELVMNFDKFLTKVTE